MDSFLSGAELLTIEATIVSAEARITAGDLGLYNEDNAAALARVRDGNDSGGCHASLSPGTDCSELGVPLAEQRLEPAIQQCAAHLEQQMCAFR